MPKIAGPMVTMASTAESTQRPKSDAAIGAPASWARVTAPSSAPGATPARSATIHSGDTTSWYRSSALKQPENPCEGGRPDRW